MDEQFQDLPDVRTALSALGNIAAGGRAKDFETLRLDFKEEAGRRGPGGTVLPGNPNSREAARALAEECCCFSNSEGGVVVVGISDDDQGSAALVGADLDAEWLRERIWDHTTPSLAVDVREHWVDGHRLLVLAIVRGHRLHRCGSRVKQRIGTHCVEMTPEAQRQWEEQRFGYDWSAEASDRTLDDISEGAVDTARDYLRATGEASRLTLANDTTPDLLRKLGVVRPDRRLTNAGALLFTSGGPVSVDYQRRAAPGTSSSDRLELSRPLLSAFAALKSRIDAVNEERHVQLRSGVQPRIRLIPDRAVREALVNALSHRDYRSADPVIVEFVGTQLIVSSPGGFPPGITTDNIISERSRPRNSALNAVFRSLRLAEQEGVGVDRMYRDMITAGHDLPAFADRSGRVRCVLSGGEPQPVIVAVMASLPAEAQDDVDLALLLHTLMRQPSVRSDEMAPVLQKLPQEAAAALRRGMTAGLLTHAAGGTRAVPAMRLTDDIRAALRPLLPYLTTSAAEAEEFVVRHLMQQDSIRSGQVAEMLGVTTVQASRVLAGLRSRDVIRYGSTATRGRGVFHVRGETFAEAARRHGLA